MPTNNRLRMIHFWFWNSDVNWLGLIVAVYSALQPVWSQTPNCPKQCICVANRMNCNKPGLTHLPTPYMSELQFLVVENQTFGSPHLGQRDLRFYLSTEYGGTIRLKQLYIRHCNIETIEPYAFKGIGPQFQMLDLTGNPLRRIGEYAFSGINHLTLILDEIKSPYFALNSFTGLNKMKSLIMRRAGLNKLPLEQLLDLVNEGKLGKLLLTGNQLRTLDIRYKAIFRNLQDFEISDNPWHCDCKLTWLIRLYRSSGQNGAFKPKHWSDSASQNWARGESQPKCASPPSLSGRSFIELITDLDEIYMHTSATPGVSRIPTVIHCPPPQIERLDIDMGKFFGEISGNDDLQLHVSKENRNLRDNPSVRLRCVVSGSSQLAVRWKQYSPELGWTNVSDGTIASTSTSVEPFSRDFNTELLPWSLKLEDNAKSESSIIIERGKNQDSYSCFGEDVLGNVSVFVRIKWPKVIPSGITSKTLEQKFLTNNKTTRPQFAISPYNEKRFTLLQLIGAIFGTLVCTIILFTVCLICYQSKLFIGEQKHPRKQECKNQSGVHPCSSSEGTSSSNTSTSNPTTTASPKLNDLPVSSVPLSFNPEAFTYHPQLYHPQLYNQAVNGSIAAQHLRLGYPSQETRSALTAQQQIQLLAGTNLSTTTSHTYEPSLYADANICNYENPWQSSMNHIAWVPISAEKEQNIPLLQNAIILTDPGGHTNAMTLADSNQVAPRIMIPPPPSIPQPSLPGSEASLTTNGSSNRTPTNGNLLAMQKGLPENNTSTLHIMDQHDRSFSKNGTTEYQVYQT